MTRNKVEPTPTPWKAAISGTRMTIVNANRFILDFEGRDGTQEDIEADAAFIVRAVNCHEDLLKAAKYAFDILMRMPEEYAEAISELTLDGESIDTGMIEAAIAKATSNEKPA